MVDAANNITRLASINLGSDADSPLDGTEKPPGNGLRQRRRDHPPMAETWGEMARAWPKVTVFIVSNEFCERFSYYGMRTVLTLYLLNVLKFSDTDASTFFNTFSALCYLSPLIGALIADGFLGKFKTIFIVSILYAIGQLILAFASIQPKTSHLHPGVDFLGLFIIAMGTGGIKPCVSPFGGDQFDPWQTRMISVFFSFFYFAINMGGMVSTFVTPIFRSTPCRGQDTCYPLAFGIPAGLMIVATIFFMLGSIWYKKPPPKSNVFKDVAVVCKKAIGNKMHASESKDHWLDHALTTHSCDNSFKCQQRKKQKRDQSACAKAKFIEDIKSLFRVLIMYIPLPIFWALYDQQASTWTIQAINMDSRIGSVLMLPDQMQVLNAVLILAFIPIFQAIVYPLFGMCFKITPLRKITAGGYLAAVAYLICAYIQFLVNKTLPMLPPSGHSYVSVVNTMQNCNITANALGYNQTILIEGGHALENRYKDTKTFNLKIESVQFEFNYTGSGCPSEGNQIKKNTFELSKKLPYHFIHVSQRGMFLSMVDPTKPKEGTGEFSTAIVSDLNFDGDFAFCRVTKELTCDTSKKEDYYYYKQSYHTEDGDLSDSVPVWDVKGNKGTVFKVKSVRPGDWRLFRMPKGTENFTWTGVQYTRKAQGGVYLLSLTGENLNNVTWVEMMVTQDNGLSILWQIPQIVVMTAAEILFSITGLEFSYTQAAPSMKAIVGAAFLLTTGFGDLIIVLVNVIHFSDDMSIIYVGYAGLMIVGMTVFALMSVFYYNYVNHGEENDDEECEEDSCEDNISSASTKQILNEKVDPFGDGAWQTKL